MLVSNGTTPDPYFGQRDFVTVITEAPGAVLIGVVFAVLCALMLIGCLLSDVCNMRQHCRYAFANCRHGFRQPTKKKGETLQENLSNISDEEVYSVTGDKKALTSAVA